MLVAIKEMVLKIDFLVKIEINFYLRCQSELVEDIIKGISTPEVSRQCDKFQIVNYKK